MTGAANARTGFSFVSFAVNPDNRPMWFAPLGDSALTIRLGEGVDAGALAAVGELAAALREADLPGLTDIVPAYATVTVFYEPMVWMNPGDPVAPCEKLCAAVSGVVETWRKARAEETRGAATHLRRGRESPPHRVPEKTSRRREIPVCYGGEFGLDLAEVAAHTGLSAEEVVARHGGVEYRVQAIGFAPGFPYLAGLPRELETPRRTTPRTEVPAGAVGIGGAQTGVYPVKSPGGWQLIGRTPLKLFDVARSEPAWLRVGDVVTFRAITSEEWVAWK